MTSQNEDRRRRYEALVRPCVEPLRRYLARRTDAATAEDVLADVLLICWRRLDAVPADAQPWLFGVARNTLRNAERAARRRDRTAARLADEHRVAADAPDGSRVRDALDALRPADAELLRLWAWEGLQPAQLSVALGITPNAAAIRLHRAKGRLAAALTAEPMRTP